MEIEKYQIVIDFDSGYKLKATKEYAKGTTIEHVEKEALKVAETAMKSAQEMGMKVVGFDLKVEKVSE